MHQTAMNTALSLKIEFVVGGCFNAPYKGIGTLEKIDMWIHYA